MTRPASARQPNGFLMIAALISMGLVSGLMATAFGVINHELGSISRAVGRAQALYLAEAGLDAANDMLNQDWRSYQRGASRFPMQEQLAVSVDGEEASIGEFDVIVTEIDPRTLRVTSTGKSMRVPGTEGAQAQYQTERTLSMVVVRKDIPSFRRIGRPGFLDLEAEYFDDDGIPDLLMTSGQFIPVNSGGDVEGTLSSGSRSARELGYHVMASCTDVDLDGDLDLVLSDALSRVEPRAAPFIPSATLSLGEDHVRAQLLTAADVMGTGKDIAFVSKGWIWLPEGTLSGTEQDVDVFINTPAYNGTRIVSWSEGLPSRQ